ncbi:3-deoxy-7-phosphoheptulonate synthase [Candidatus Woesearchaeota archaeon]|nr:3-deoxy-7-phosphoheptulonate synthase [Candidatus Woesearchaeota archaeon]
MIIVMKQGAKKENIEAVIDLVAKNNLKPVPLYGTERTVIAVIGDERVLNKDTVEAMDDVEKVMEVLKPYKLAAREYHPENTIIKVGEGANCVNIGGKEIVVMAGPCAVENKEQIISIAKEVKKAGAKILRGGAFKPRTAPYDFQGLGEQGLKYLAAAREETGLKIVTEVVDPRDVALVEKYADILQVGTRNMQNYTLLKELGKAKKPVLLKRGMWATYKEWLLAAEYIISSGNPNVILCERGIRTFETHTRNTLDLAAVPALKELTHLPIVVDPSHGTGRRSLVSAMCKAAIATGCDGLIIESHTHPEKSVSDAEQTISTEVLKQLMKDFKKVAEAVGRKI